MATESSSSSMEIKDQQPKWRNQDIKISSVLKKITNLQLTSEKQLLMENSIFSKLVQVKNKRESSSALISVLSSLYDAESRKFVFNNEASLSFCIREVAEVLGIENTGTDHIFSTENSAYNNFLDELKVFFNWEEDKEFKASDLKNLLREMPIIDDQSKLYFRQLLSFYLVDQVLVCSGNSKKLNPKSWGAVQDLHAFEKINWAKIVFEHICDSLKHLKGQMCHSGQHVFKGFAPVVEAILYERIPSIQPPTLKAFLDPPIQKYSHRRWDVQDVKSTLVSLTANQIKPCPWYCEGAAEGDASLSMHSLALNDTFVDDGAAIEDGVLVDDDASVKLDADAAAKDGAASIKAKKKNAQKKAVEGDASLSISSLAVNDTFVDDGASIEDGVLVDDDASMNLDADAAAKDGAASIKAKKKKPDDVSKQTIFTCKLQNKLFISHPYQSLV
ncbi:unnamed protein product [Trifolium pratense]|uniref:Uncharacterized protein n=1 Tax=Trifolium pratense TaxID=57577 RepID=A0ACB0JB39_TRIPR|nr:unnamed protein product [Trifolium pratense]